jgi:hypothetical protein
MMAGSSLRGARIEVDVYAHDEEAYLIEVKGLLEEGDVDWFDQKCKVASELIGKRVRRRIIVAFTATKESLERAKRLNIDVIYGALVGLVYYNGKAGEAPHAGRAYAFPLRLSASALRSSATASSTGLRCSSSLRSSSLTPLIEPSMLPSLPSMLERALALSVKTCMLCTVASSMRSWAFNFLTPNFPKTSFTTG